MQFLAKEALTPQCHATSSRNLDVPTLYISSLPRVVINRKYDTNIIFTITTSHLSSLYSSHSRTDHPYSVIPTNSNVRSSKPFSNQPRYNTDPTSVIATCKLYLSRPNQIQQ